MDVGLYACNRFAQTLCKALGDFAYVVSGQVNSETHEVITCSNWAGAVPEGTISRAPHIAYGKFGELVLLGGGSDGQLVMTPVPGNKESYGWMGGVAQNGVIVAVSKWAQEHDRLLALLTLYHTVHHDLILHHAGFRFPDLASYEAANALFEDGIERLAEDHERTYFKLGYNYREHQFFPDGPCDNARHWDFMCQHPEDLLWFIARAYGKEPIFWEAGKNDPVGVVWIQAESNGSKLGVMVRKDWWTVEGIKPDQMLHL